MNTNATTDFKLELRSKEYELRQTCVRLSNLLKMPTDIAQEDNQPMYGYQLRGVAIRHGLTYVYRDCETGAEWWKFEYGPPLHHMEVSEEEVYQAAYRSKGPLFLVYASDDACERRPVNFSDSVQVRRGSSALADNHQANKTAGICP
jgi:hypothetical protein